MTQQAPVQPYDFVLGRHPTKIICDGKGPPRLDLEPSPGMIIDCRGEKPTLVQTPPEPEPVAATTAPEPAPQAADPAPQPKPVKKKVVKKPE